MGRNDRRMPFSPATAQNQITRDQETGSKILSRVRSLTPVIDQLLCANQFELLAKPLVAEGNDRVVRLVGNTAHRVGDYDHPITTIHSAQQRCKNAKVCFSSADDQSMNAPFVQISLEKAFGPG